MSSIKVPLPDFFIALVLPEATREPTARECEELRLKTVEFWRKRLKEVSFPKKFKGLDLTYEKQWYGSPPPDCEDEAKDLGERFNSYLQVSGTATFSSNKGAGIPSGNETFAEMTKSDSLAYLVDFVRKLGKESFFSTAVEVVARRVHADPKGEGGTVRAPSFFVAFATAPYEDEEPKGPPTDADVEAYRGKTEAQIDKHLHAAYPHTYESCELTVIRAEAGTSQPDERFEIYIENNFKAKFSSDPPTEAELFNIVMKCGGTESTEYLMDMQKINGSQFEDVSMVCIQVIGLEMPEVEELETPEPQVGEPGNAEEEHDPDEVVVVHVPIFLALVVSEKLPASLPGREELEEFKDLMFRFFYTVIRNEYSESLTNLKLHELSTKFDGGIPEPRFNMCTEYDAELYFKPGTDPPDEKQLQMLILECNLSSVLAHTRNLTPLCFQQTTEVTMRRESQKENEDPINDAVFEAAIDLPPPPPLLALPPPPPAEPEKQKEASPPLPPHKKEKKTTPAPPPPPKEKNTTPSPPPPPKKEKKTTPAPLPPPKKEKKTTPAPPPPLKKEKETTTAPPPPPKKEKKTSPSPPPPPKKEKKTSPSPPPVKEPELKAKKPAPKPKPASKPKLAAEPIKATEAPKKTKKKKAQPPVVKDDGYSSPAEDEHDGPVAKVASSDVYVALKLDGIDSPPSDEEIERLRVSTKDFFSKRLKTVFPGVFVKMDLDIGVMEFGAGKPRKDFNLYVEWVIDGVFKDLSVPSSPVKNIRSNMKDGTGRTHDGLPDSIDVTRALVKGVNIIDYLVEHVRVLEGSFANGTMVFIQQRVDEEYKK